MRLAIWNTNYFRRFGGAEKAVHNLINRFTELGIESFLIANRTNGSHQDNQCFSPLNPKVRIYQNTFTNPWDSLNNPFLFLVKSIQYLKAALQFSHFLYKNKIQLVLETHGYRFFWCSEALVFETVTPERANLSWILKRYFRNGNITYRLRDKAPSDRSVGSRTMILRALARVAISIIILPFYGAAAIFHRQSSLRALQNLEEIAFQIGFLSSSVNFTYEEYRPTKDQSFQTNAS